MALTVLIVVLLLLLVIGVPLPYSLGASALAALVATGDGIPLTVVPQRFVAASTTLPSWQFHSSCWSEI